MLWDKTKRHPSGRNHLTNDDILDGMTKLPMAKLMTQNSKDLWVVASLFFVL